MEQVGVFLLGWLIVGFLVALAVGKYIREANRLDEPATPTTADRQRPERRISIRRAQDRGGQTHWDLETPDRRQRFGRRSEDRV
jgi:hypothetical protein